MSHKQLSYLILIQMQLVGDIVRIDHATQVLKETRWSDIHMSVNWGLRLVLGLRNIARDQLHLCIVCADL